METDSSDEDVRNFSEKLEFLEKSFDEYETSDNDSFEPSTLSTVFDTERAVQYVCQMNLKSIVGKKYVIFMNRQAESMHFVVRLRSKRACQKISRLIWVRPRFHFLAFVRNAKEKLYPNSVRFSNTKALCP